ncbi:hypothetical protein ST47_g2164 [Ascochyta rabiei]|uniref:Uncharacterized protein n=1 Tax=Didymella rabiei TaxID=5454 RepID=A0A163K1G4_DIDRA|nr:hypothetical protein ST47_g2164 [Ascochyta rabiei]
MKDFPGVSFVSNGATSFRLKLEPWHLPSTTPLPSSFPFCLARRPSGVCVLELLYRAFCPCLTLNAPPPPSPPPRRTVSIDLCTSLQGLPNQSHCIEYLSILAQAAMAALAPPRPSPFAGQPFDVAVAGTGALVEEWLEVRKVSETPGVCSPTSSVLVFVSEYSLLGQSTMAKSKKWYHGCISGVPILTLVKRLWTASGEGLRTNRYRLPRWVYLTVFSMMWAAAIGQVAVAIPEALEASRDQWKNSQPKTYDDPMCSKLPVDRAYRILVRGAVAGLPMLVTLTIFLFPALYKA